MNTLKNIILYSSFVGIAIFSSCALEAKTAGEKLDRGIEKTREACEKAKDKAKDTYSDAKDKAKDAKEKVKDKYNEGLEKAKTR